MLLILRSFHKTRYILTERKFHIEPAKLIGGEKRIPLEEGQAVEKMLMPLGIKLFGVSFHEGYYNIHGLGRATLAKTNFKDELPIKIRKRGYIITTNNSISFKNAIETNVYT